MIKTGCAFVKISACCPHPYDHARFWMGIHSLRPQRIKFSNVNNFATILWSSEKALDHRPPIFSTYRSMEWEGLEVRATQWKARMDAKHRGKDELCAKREGCYRSGLFLLFCIYFVIWSRTSSYMVVGMLFMLSIVPQTINLHISHN